MPTYQAILRVSVVVLIAAISMVYVLNAAGQSGRRSKKSPPAAPIPAPAEEPTPKPVEKPKPSVTLIVGMERYDGFGTNVNSGSILRAVMDRLDDSSAVKVEGTSANMNRSDAIRRAKSEEAAYVVLLELEEESRTAVQVKVNELAIQYTVFSPGTAKLKAFGRTYPQAARGGGVIYNPRQTVYGDYQMQQAARHAADKILDAFHLPLANKVFVASKD